jgi:hypothetical protein
VAAALPAATSRLDGLLQCRDDAGMAVPEDHRSPGADVVDIAVAVEVVQVSPFAASEEDRLAPDSAKGAGGAVDAARNELLSAGERGLAAGTGHDELCHIC